MTTHIPFTPLVHSLPASVPFVGPETLERQRGEIFKARIGANESAFGQSALATQAMQDALAEDGCNWYGDPENHDLREALAAKHGVSTDEICVDAGIDSLLGLTVRMVMEPGSVAVSSSGAYPTFNYHVAGFGGRLCTVPYRNNHEDPQALLERATSENARLVYLSNPDNPMSTCLPASAIQQMIDELPPASLFILDEAYTEFAGSHQPPAIDTSNTQVLRYRTFSKAYGMAGMRIGYVIAHRDLVTGLNKIRNHFAVNRLAQIGALAALNDTGFLGSVQEQVETGRQRIYSMAQDLDLPFIESFTNFVPVSLGNGDRARAILKRLNGEGIFIRMPAIAPLDNYIRVGVGKPEEHQAFEKVFRELVAPALSNA